jgi:hypothetical protein
VYKKLRTLFTGLKKSKLTLITKCSQKSKNYKTKKWELAKFETGFLILTIFGACCYKDNIAFFKLA